MLCVVAFQQVQLMGTWGILAVEVHQFVVDFVLQAGHGSQAIAETRCFDDANFFIVSECHDATAYLFNLTC